MRSGLHSAEEGGWALVEPRLEAESELPQDLVEGWGRRGLNGALHHCLLSLPG